MKLNDGIFAVKLCELEEQYGKLQYKIRVCEQGEYKKIQTELQKAIDEFEEKNQILKERIKNCRSKAVLKLSGAQLEYRQKTQELMREQIVSDIHSDDSSAVDDKKEASALYAEFAMDFAALSVQQALIAALSALKEQVESDVSDRIERR